jgi:hypothetical protein
MKDVLVKVHAWKLYFFSLNTENRKIKVKFGITFVKKKKKISIINNL